MASDATVRTAVLRSFKKDEEVSFVAKVVSVNGPFTVRKKDGGEFLKFEALLQNYEREVVKVNAFGPHPSFQLQRMLPLNALVQLDKFVVTEARFVSFRVGTLAVEFKYAQSSKVQVLKADYVLPELPLSTVSQIRGSNNVRRRILLTPERMVLGQDNTILMGNVVMKHPTDQESLRMFCIIKGASAEKKEAVQAGADMRATVTVRQDNDGSPKVCVESWHDLAFGEHNSADDCVVLPKANETCSTKSTTFKSVITEEVHAVNSVRAYATVQQIEDPSSFGKVAHQVKCSLASPFELIGNRHVGAIFISDGDEFLSATLVVTRAPVSIENLPADSSLYFSGVVMEDSTLGIRKNINKTIWFYDGELVFTVAHCDLKEHDVDEEAEETGEPTTIVPDFEAVDLERMNARTNCFIVAKLAKRFEPCEEGYVGFVTMVDKRSLALKVLLLDADENWSVDLPVNSVLRLCGSVERAHKRFTIVVGSPEDFVVLEEGTDRKSLCTLKVRNDEAQTTDIPTTAVNSVVRGAEGAINEDVMATANQCEETNSNRLQETQNDDQMGDDVPGGTTTGEFEKSQSPPSISAAITASSVDILESVLEDAGLGKLCVNSTGSVSSERTSEEPATTTQIKRKPKVENNSLDGFGSAMARANGIPETKRNRKK